MRIHAEGARVTVAQAVAELQLKCIGVTLDHVELHVDAVVD
jgi:hypothetical protein